MSYYATIEGQKMDAELVDQAAKFVQGSGDGRISMKDAESLMELVKDGNVITDIEKATVNYLFKAHRWTDGAEKWFRQEMLAFESKKGPVHCTIDELSTRHFATTDVLVDSLQQKARKNALKVASEETNSDHEEIELWIRLNDGTTVKIFSNFLEIAGDFVELRGGCMVPIRAIEKVAV
jgi:hypothetical protein